MNQKRMSADDLRQIRSQQHRKKTRYTHLSELLHYVDLIQIESKINNKLIYKILTEVMEVTVYIS